MCSYAVPPRIDKNSFNPHNKFKAGTAFKVNVKFIGEPAPDVAWSINQQVCFV